VRGYGLELSLMAGFCTSGHDLSDSATTMSVIFLHILCNLWQIKSVTVKVYVNTNQI
jgi:hypothetical protein